LYKNTPSLKRCPIEQNRHSSDFAAGVEEKGYTSRPKFPEKKFQFFREIPASQGIPNFVKKEKKQGNPDFSSKSSEELFFQLLSGKSSFLILIPYKSFFFYESVLLWSFLPIIFYAQSFLLNFLFPLIFFGIIFNAACS